MLYAFPEGRRRPKDLGGLEDRGTVVSNWNKGDRLNVGNPHSIQETYIYC